MYVYVYVHISMTIIFTIQFQRLPPLWLHSWLLFGSLLGPLFGPRQGAFLSQNIRKTKPFQHLRAPKRAPFWVTFWVHAEPNLGSVFADLNSAGDLRKTYSYQKGFSFQKVLVEENQTHGNYAFHFILLLLCNYI